MWVLPNDDGVDELHFTVGDLNYSMTAKAEPVTFADGGYVFSHIDPPDEYYLADGRIMSYNNGQWFATSGSGDVMEWSSGWIYRNASGVLYTHDSPNPIYPPDTGWRDQEGRQVNLFIGSDLFYNAYESAGAELFYDPDKYSYIARNKSDHNEYYFNDQNEPEGDYELYGDASKTMVISGGTAHQLARFDALGYSTTYQDYMEQDFESVFETTSMIQTTGVLERDVVRAVRIVLYLVESKGGDVSPDGGVSWYPIPYDDDELFTGHKSVRVNSGNTEYLRVMVRATGSDPMEVTGIAVDVEHKTTRSQK